MELQEHSVLDSTKLALLSAGNAVEFSPKTLARITGVTGQTSRTLSVCQARAHRPRRIVQLHASPQRQCSPAMLAPRLARPVI